MVERLVFDKDDKLLGFLELGMHQPAPGDRFALSVVESIKGGNYLDGPNPLPASATMCHVYFTWKVIGSCRQREGREPLRHRVDVLCCDQPNALPLIRGFSFVAERLGQRIPGVFEITRELGNYDGR